MPVLGREAFDHPPRLIQRLYYISRQGPLFQINQVPLQLRCTAGAHDDGIV